MVKMVVPALGCLLCIVGNTDYFLAAPARPFRRGLHKFHRKKKFFYLLHSSKNEFGLNYTNPNFSAVSA
jgi:hypothetical protein